MSRGWRWAAVVVILLAAALIRLWDLGRVPPGLSHDEVANWLIAQDILSGEHAIYFTEAYGHEPLYHYAQATTVALFGDQWVGLRWLSVAFSLLGIAMIYTLVRRLFGLSVALLAAAWLSVSFWPLFYARVGLRAVALPFTAAAAAYFFCSATGLSVSPTPARSTGPRGNERATALLAGLFLGLSLYTYMAARILPFIFAAFVLYSVFLSSPSIGVSRSTIILISVAAIVVSTPLMAWLASHPGAEYRIAEIREPLERLLEGDPRLVWENLVANLKMFTITGDPWPQQNVPGRPVFVEPTGAMLFYAGVAVALWRWRDPRYGLLLIWLIGALGPSVATSVAPNSIRTILAWVVLFIYPALGCVEIWRWVKSRRRFTDTWTRVPRYLLPGLAAVLLGLCCVSTVRDYFVRWPQNEDVRYFYQADLTAVARQLDRQSVKEPTAVAGLSIHTMDRPTLELTASRSVEDIRLCDTRQTLVIPRAEGGEGRLFVPRVVPLDEDLRQRLMRWAGADAKGPEGSFTIYHLSDRAALERDLARLDTRVSAVDGSAIELPASFGGYLAFLGYEWLDSDVGTRELLTYWRVDQPPSTRLKIFVHLFNEAGDRVGQHDGLGSSQEGWAAGDLVVQKHVLTTPTAPLPSLVRPQIGLYDALSGSRLSVAASEWLSLPPIRLELE